MSSADSQSQFPVDVPNVGSANPQGAGPPRRRRRALKVLIVGVLGVLILFALTPTIVSWSPLRHEFPRQRLRGFTGNIRVGRASLSWWGPTVLEDVELDDLDGHVFAKIQHYTEFRSVLAMIFRKGEPSLIHAENAEITVVLRPDGSNVEEAMRPVIENRKNRPKRDRTVEVVNATLHVTDSTNGRRADWKEIQLNAHTTPVLAAENTFRLQAKLVDAPEAAPLNLEYDWTTVAEESASSDQKRRLHFKSEKLPLRFLAPLYSRFAKDLELSGAVSADLNLALNGEVKDATAFDTEGQLSLQDLKFACPSRIGNDQFALQELALRGRLAADGGLVEAREFAIESDLGKLTANGKFPIGTFEGSADEAIEHLQKADFDLRGDLDLVQVAQLLPETLGLRAGARITGGKLILDVGCHPRDDVAHWNGKLDTTRLAGEVDGQPVSWDQPITLKFDVSRTVDRLEIQELECRSDVFELTGHGDSNAAHVEGRCDLSQLTERLGRFVELQERQIRGAAEFRVDLKRLEDRSLDVKSVATIENLSVGDPGREPWTEPRLTAQLECRLIESRLRPQQIPILKGAFVGAEESDRVTITLLEPVHLNEGESAWNMSLELAGDLGRWRSRLRRSGTPSAWKLAGTIGSKSRLQVSREAVLVTDLQTELHGLRIAGHGIELTEPVVAITGGAAWDRRGRRLTVPSLEWSAATGKITATDMTYVVGDGTAPTLVGKVEVDSDLALLNPPEAREADRSWGGTVHGRVALSVQDGETYGDWRLDVENLIYKKELQRFIEKRRGEIEPIPIEAPPLDIPRPPPGTVIDRRMRRAIERAERDARREMQKREKAARRLADEIVMVPTTEWKTLWEDPRLTIVGVTRLNFGADFVELTSLAVETAGLTWSARGKVSDVSQEAKIDLTGEVDYDVETLLGRMQNAIGHFIKVTGKERREFSLHGPLRAPAGVASESLLSRELQGSAGAGWLGGTLFGLEAGPANLELRLADAVLAIQPFEETLSGGSLRLAPEIRLGRRPATLYFPAGPVLTNVALTQEVCDGWLKFIAPVVSEAARAEGRLSLSIEETELPLMDLASGQMQGQLQIERAQVLPGPLFAELAGFLGQIEATISRDSSGSLLGPDAPLMVIDKQNVNFQLRDRRLYHSPMVFNVKGVPVRTRGSVGTDQSLDLLAEILFPAPWARRVPLIAHLDGKVFEVPIRGTLRHPKIDGRAIGKAWEQFGLDVLDNLFNGGLIPR